MLFFSFSKGVDQWFSNFLHQRNGKKRKKNYGPVIQSCNE